MSRISEDALKRGLEAANHRIASLEQQLAMAEKDLKFYKELAAEEEVDKERAEKRYSNVAKALEKKVKKD